MIELKDENQLKEGTVFVELYSQTCGSCKKQMAIIDKVEPEFTNITFTKCDSETKLGNDLCISLNLMQAPSMLIYKNGELIKQFGGLTVPAKLKEILGEV